LANRNPELRFYILRNVISASPALEEAYQAVLPRKEKTFA